MSFEALHVGSHFEFYLLGTKRRTTAASETTFQPQNQSSFFLSLIWMTKKASVAKWIELQLNSTIWLLKNWNMDIFTRLSSWLRYRAFSFLSRIVAMLTVIEICSGSLGTIVRKGHSELHWNWRNQVGHFFTSISWQSPNRLQTTKSSIDCALVLLLGPFGTSE